MDLPRVLESRRERAVLRGDDAAGVVAAAATPAGVTAVEPFPAGTSGSAPCSPRDIRRRDRGPVVHSARTVLRLPVRA